MNESQCITYHIDKNDCISFVDKAWSNFAVNNDSPQLTQEHVLGHKLFEYITNEDCKHIYALIFQKVRNEKRTYKLPFRCDSPNMRRFLEIEIHPLEENGIAFNSCTLKLEARNPVILLDSKISRSRRILKICSWCKMIEIKPDKWVDLEIAIKELNLFQDANLPKLSHGMCKSCYDTVQDLIK